MQVRLNALLKTQSASSTQMVSFGNVWLFFSSALRLLFGDPVYDLSMTGLLRLSGKIAQINASACMHKATFAFEQFLHLTFL
jgi:hypothetical protein